MSTLAWLPWTVGACVLCVYLGTLSDNHTEAEDALHYVNSIASGGAAALFHPNHLLFNVAGAASFRVARAVGHGGDPMLPLQLLNAVAGSLTAALLTRLALLRGFGPALGSLTAIGCAASYGFWWYSVEAETYILPLPFVVLAIERIFTSGDRPTFRRGVEIGVLGAVATLLHQQHALVFLPLGLGLWLVGRKDGSAVDRAKPLIGMGVSATLLVGVPYLLTAALIFEKDSFAEVIRWSFGHARGGPWMPLSASSPMKAVVGFSRSLLGLHFLLSFDVAMEAAERAFPTKILFEERFLAETIGPVSRVIASIASLVAAASGAVLLLELWRTHKVAGRKREDGFLACVACAIATYSAVNVLWEPYNPEFWIGVLPWVFLGFGEILKCGIRSHRATRTLAVFVMSLTVANFAGSVWPQATRNGDYWYQANRQLSELARPGDLIVTEGGYISNGYLKRGSPAEILTVGSTPPAELQKRMKEHEGRVIVSSWAIEPPQELLRSGQFATWDRKASAAILAPYLKRVKRQVDDPYQTLWVVQRE